jgi:hypothetical protein
LSGDTEVRRYRVSPDNANLADAASRTGVLAIDQPAGLSNHKAGWMGFGEDGYLYVAVGDGGGGGDPLETGQNINDLLGNILRIDIRGDSFTDPARNYAVPADNPFVGRAGADEVFAFGLRNPWRNSFDRWLGDFYIADVGQNLWEEINLGRRGANYGWDVREGPAPFEAGTLTGGAADEPIHVYGRDVGSSVTGGYVYRGPSEGLQGRYFFADFPTGRMFTLHFDGAAWVREDRTGQIVTDVGAINLPSSFGEDGRGDLYVVDLDGDVFRLTPIVVSGDQGNVINGGGGADVLFGGSGHDTLQGGRRGRPRPRRQRLRHRRVLGPPLVLSDRRRRARFAARRGPSGGRSRRHRRRPRGRGIQVRRPRPIACDGRAFLALHARGFCSERLRPQRHERRPLAA